MGGSLASSACACQSKEKGDDAEPPTVEQHCDDAEPDTAEQYRVEKRETDGRRTNVSRLSICSDPPSELALRQVVSEEDQAFIAAAFQKSPNLERIASSLNMEELASFGQREQIAVGSVITVGANLGDAFVYIVHTGRFNSSARETFGRSISEGSNGKPVEASGSSEKELGPGDCFGDVALLHSAEHTILLEAIEPSVVWKFNWSLIKSMMQGRTESQIEEYVKYLSRLEILSNVSAHEKETLALALSEVRYSRDDVIFQAGDPATSFFILVDGCLDVTIEGEHFRTIQATKGKNEVEYFGDRALLANEPRKWTVVVTSESAHCLELQKDDFTELLGPLGDILDKKRASYNVNVHPYVRYLDNLSILNALGVDQKEELAKTLKLQEYRCTETLFRVGDPALEFYILLDGVLEVFKEGRFLKKIEADSGRNLVEHFGERALMQKEPRKWTVKVASDTAQILIMDGKTFLKRLGALKEVKESQAKVQSRNSSVGDTRVCREDLQVAQVIGAGRFGPLELCKHRSTGDMYTLKTCFKGLIVQKELQKAVLREESIWSTLDFPLILKLYGTYNEPKSLCFLMELAQGGVLPALYDRENLYGSIKHTKFYVAGVILAINHLHSLRIVHRSIESGNILVSLRGYPKLSGFRVAKVVTGKTATTCGTLEYMAPEMLMGNPYNRSVDWWALGVLTFELMAGMLPFGSGSSATSLILRGVGKVTFPKSISVTTSSFIRQMLQDDPSLRLGLRAQSLNKHAWLANFKWDSMKALKLVPPYKPSEADLEKSKVNPADLVEEPEYHPEGVWDHEFGKTAG